MKKKGAKTFAPKFPARRPAAPSSAQSSARPSVERQSQTPIPQVHPETITITDDHDSHNLTNDPSSSRTIESTPHQLLFQTPQDAPAPTHIILDASAHNSATHVQNTGLPPDNENLKRKTRDGEGEVEVPSKRRQPSASGLDAPKSPPHSTLIEQTKISDARSRLAQRSEISQLSTLESTQQLSELSQPPTAAPPVGDDVPADEPPRREGAERFNSLQASSRAPRIAATTSQRRSLPDNRQNDPASEIPDPEVSLGPAGASSGLGAAGDVGSFGANGGQLAQTPVIVPMAPLNPDGTPGEAVHQPATGTKKKASKRRKVQQAEGGGDIRATVEMQLNRPPRAPGKKPPRKRKEGVKKSSKRADTPEGAEDEEIDTSAMTMLDMCKDLRIGKKFSMHDELRQREKQKVFQAKIAKYPHLAEVVEGDDEEAEGGEEDERGQAATTTPQAEAPDTAPEVNGTTGPRMRIVDGQLVLDESSMQLDRQKLSQQQQGNLEVVAENEFSKIFTCGSHMKREKAQLWDMAANEIFWKGLKMFGTDFEMIARLFPHRNRRQIKLKFSKEEKDNPVKMDRILKGVGSSIELDTFEELSGMKLEEVADIEAERERIEAEQQAEEDRRIAEQAEAERKKVAEIEAKNAAVKKATTRVADMSDDSGDEGHYVGDSGDSGEKENRPAQEQRPRETQSQGHSLRRNNPKGLAPGEKYPWQRPSQAETAEKMRQQKASEGKPQYAWTKTPKAKASKEAPKAPRASRQGGAKNKRKKDLGGADETVQVLGDA